MSLYSLPKPPAAAVALRKRRYVQPLVLLFVCASALASAGEESTSAVILADYERIGGSEMILLKVETSAAWLTRGESFKGYQVTSIDSVLKRAGLAKNGTSMFVALDAQSTPFEPGLVDIGDIRLFFHSDKSEISEIDVWKKFGRPADCYPLRHPWPEKTDSSPTNLDEAWWVFKDHDGGTVGVGVDNLKIIAVTYTPPTQVENVWWPSREKQ